MLTNRYASRTRVRRAFVPHAQGALHVRWAGEGAPLFALHESPRSSLSLLPLIDGLAARRTVVAFDTPGYGHSDPLPQAVPEGGDFARAFLQAFDALGVRSAAVYATHTGAALGIFAALAEPARIAALVLDGYAAFDAAEREDFVGRYLAPFEPAWDGSHVAQLWSRCRDLFLWFPYHQRVTAKRLVYDPPGPDKVHDTVLGKGETWLDRAFVVRDWYVSAYQPLLNGHRERIGMLYVGFLEGPFVDARRHAFVVIVGLFGLAMLLAGLFAILWAQRVFKPIERMHATMNAIEQGQDGARVGTVGSQDELAIVAAHFDRMLDKLHAQAVGRLVIAPTWLADQFDPSTTVVSGVPGRSRSA